MPISFPSNPSSGDTYDFGGIHYIYNGDGWVNKSIYGVSAGSGISFANYNGTGPVVISVIGGSVGATGATGATGPQGNTGATGPVGDYVISFNGYTGEVVGWAHYNDGIGSTLDAGLIHGISGQRFVENLQTGLLYGGLIQVNAGNSALFDITAGSGVVSFAGASLTAYPVPSLSYINWGNFTGLTLSGITSYEETWVSINSSGNVVQQNTKWSDSQFDTSIPLGVLIHPNNASINFGVAIPHVAYGQPSQLDPFVRAFGPIKISGHEISANGANLQVNKSSGSAYIIGRNYSTDPSSPNVVNDTDASPITTIYRYYRDGSGKFTIVTAPTIDPANYDDGTGTLNTVAGGLYTIQRMFFLPGVPSVLGVYYGRETYSSIQTAQANIPFELFNEDDSTASLGVFAGYLIVKSTATQLNNTADAKFISSGIFRNLSNIGGGGVAVANLDDLTDVAITSVANNNVLKYDSGTSQWVNASLTSFFTDYVFSFNGKTGAVQGVSAAVAGTGISVSGATGSVTITNTGVLSFNGNTGAIQGVSSVNGATGAITNVAKTNANNSFTSTQSIIDSSTGNDLSINASSSRISFYDGTSGEEASIVFPSSIITTTEASLPSFTTELAGLDGTQTFTGNKTFSTITNFSAGLSASGATFNGSVNLQNGEFIRNTTNGRVDIMPAPSGSTHFGIYFDHTSWSYGVAIGTIRSSDGALNTSGNIRFDVPFTLANDTLFQIGNDGHYRFRRTTAGNDTAQFAAFCNGTSNSGAYAIIGYGSEGNANRSPATLHTNPNLYIYANGATSANDYVRFEHDTTRALIETGGTSGLTLNPGSGIVGVSGAIVANGYQLSSSGINAQTGTTYSLLSTDNGEVITFNNGSPVTVTIPTGLPIGFNCTAIQLGAGQVGFTAAAGVTLNSYGGLLKLAGQHGAATIISYTTNVYNIAGTLST